jgi:hypothetical protein
MHAAQVFRHGSLARADCLTYPSGLMEPAIGSVTFDPAVRPNLSRGSDDEGINCRDRIRGDFPCGWRVLLCSGATANPGNQQAKGGQYRGEEEIRSIAIPQIALPRFFVFSGGPHAAIAVGSGVELSLRRGDENRRPEAFEPTSVHEVHDERDLA